MAGSVPPSLHMRKMKLSSILGIIILYSCLYTAAGVKQIVTLKSATHLPAHLNWLADQLLLLPNVIPGIDDAIDAILREKFKFTALAHLLNKNNGLIYSADLPSNLWALVANQSAVVHVEPVRTFRIHQESISQATATQQPIFNWVCVV